MRNMVLLLIIISCVLIVGCTFGDAINNQKSEFSHPKMCGNIDGAKK